MKIFLFLLVLQLLTAPGWVAAATKGMFFFDSMRQTVTFEYDYQGVSVKEKGEGTVRSSRHRFEENYRMDINYTLLGPNLLFGSIGLETQLDQVHSSNSGASSNSGTDSGARLLYDLDGTFLRYHPVSVRFYSHSRWSSVSREFSQDYDQTISTNGISLHAKNKIIPFDVEYRTAQTETDGLTSDYKRDDDTLMINARHDIARFSSTYLDLRFDDYHTDYDSDLDDYDLESSRLLLTNTLTGYSRKNIRRLSSRYKYVEQVGSQDLKGYDWTENLDWHFGRALIGNLYYNRFYTKRDEVDLVQDSELLKNRVRASLRHQLVEAIDTQIGFEWWDTDQKGDGKERDISGDINVAYRKRLPRRSYLHTNVYYRQGNIDRDFDSYIRNVVDEPHTASIIVPIVLDQQYVLPDAIVVRNADQAVRPDPYIRDLDYQVDQVGVTTLISILPGSDISDGTSLLISYNYLSNAQEEYDYRIYRANATLEYDEDYRFYARWEQTTRDYKSGDDLLDSSTGDLRELVLGFDGNWRRSTFGAEYKYRDAYYEDRQSFEAFFQQAMRIKKGVLTAGVGNYYATVDPTGNTKEYWTNTFSANSKFLTPVWRRGSVSLYGRYANTQSRIVDRDDITLGFDFRYSYGKFIMTLDAKVDWRLIDDQTRREEMVNLRLTRYL